MPPKQSKKEAVARPDNSGIPKNDVDIKWTLKVTSSSASIPYVLMFQWFGPTSQKVERYDTPLIENWIKRTYVHHIEDLTYCFEKEFSSVRVDDDFVKRLCNEGFEVYVLDPKDGSVKDQIKLDLSSLLMSKGELNHNISCTNDKLKTMEIQSLTITVQANRELLPSVYRSYLNPFEVEVIGAKNVPDESSKSFLPAYVKYKLFDSPVICTHSMVGKNKLVWAHKHVFLLGLMDGDGLKDKIRSTYLRFELHDRDQIKNVDVMQSLELVDVKRLIQLDQQREKPKEEDPKKKGKEQKKEVKKEVKKDNKKKDFEGQLVFPPVLEAISSSFGVAAFYLVDFLNPHTTHIKLKSPVVPRKLFEDYQSRNIDLNTTARTEMQKVISSNTYFDNDTTLAVSFTLSSPIGSFVKPTPPVDVVPQKQEKKGGKQPPVVKKEDPNPVNQPHVTQQETPSKQDIFQRIIYMFPYKNPQLVKSIQDTYYTINLQAMKMPAESLKQLTNMVLKPEQKTNKQLDIITGVEIIDNEFRMFILEGLKDGSMKLFQQLIRKESPNSKTFKILRNTGLSFINRLYIDFNLQIKRIRLRPSLDGLLVDPTIYARSKIPEEICNTLNNIANIKKVAQNLKMVTTMNLWPSSQGLLLVENKFSSPLSHQDLTGTVKQVKSSPKVLTSLPPIQQATLQTSTLGIITKWSEVFQDDVILGKESANKAPTHTYQKTDLNRFESYNKQMRRADIPDGEPVFMYAGQKNNWYQKKMGQLREKVKGDKNHSYTYSNNHMSMSLNPHTVQGAKRAEIKKNQALQYGNRRFDNVLVRTNQERMRLAKKPDQQTIRDMQRIPYHQGKTLERTLLKSTRALPVNQQNKQEFVQFIGSTSVFSRPQILPQETLTAEEKDREGRQSRKKKEQSQKSKLKGDPSMHMKKLYCGDKTSQLDRLQDIREGSPSKRGLILPDKIIQKSKIGMSKIIQHQPVSIFINETYNDQKDLLSRVDRPELNIGPHQFNNFQNPQFLTKSLITKPLKKSNFQ